MNYANQEVPETEHRLPLNKRKKEHECTHMQTHKHTPWEAVSEHNGPTNSVSC